MQNNDAAAFSAAILVVDDSTEMRTIIKAALTRHGNQIWEAANLAQAREILRQRAIELVLTDIGLARESGLDLLHELAPRSPEIAVVMMTGMTDLQTAIDCLREGAFDYLTKPFSVADLERVLARVLGRKRKLVAERQRTEEQLRILGKFSSENPNPVLRVDTAGTLLYANRASAALRQEWQSGIGQPLPGFVCQLIAGVLNQQCPAHIEVAGAGRWYSLAVTPIKDADYVYLYGHDITNLKETEQELIRLKDQAQELALHDALTGLPNRTLLADRLGQALAYCERHRVKLALAFLDLDNFKEINDTRGHRLGDQVLMAVARHLSQGVRKTDTVARWGGDELILLLPGLEPPGVRPICERLKEKVQQQLAGEFGFFMSLSMGVALYPDDASNGDLLLQAADAALYLAKARKTVPPEELHELQTSDPALYLGKVRARQEVVFFGESPALEAVRQKTDLHALLGQAVAGRRIQVYYQPILEARTGQVVGAEALARWQEDGHGWISPNTFIPMAEQLGLIDQLGHLVLEQALQELSAWQQEGWPLALSVNLSLRQLVRYDFLKDILELTRHWGVRPEQLILEMTESQALLGLTTEGTRLAELFRSGFRLSIDDFGQGHSSLASLHEMPAAELKIDMAFIQNLQNEKCRRIVQTIIELSRSLGLETVAEGVEEPGQVALLQQMGVTRLQGYYFSRPLPGPEFRAFLEQHRAGRQTGV